MVKKIYKNMLIPLSFLIISILTLNRYFAINLDFDNIIIEIICISLLILCIYGIIVTKPKLINHREILATYGGGFLVLGFLYVISYHWLKSILGDYFLFLWIVALIVVFIFLTYIMARFYKGIE